MCIIYLSETSLLYNWWLTHLTEHRQLLGEVHHSGDGRGDDFCKLTEGFDVHLASLRCADDRPLTYVFSLKWQEMGGARCLATRDWQRMHQFHLDIYHIRHIKSSLPST